jgi:hypothetical protein
METKEFLDAVGRLRKIMVEVATGVTRIRDVNDEFRSQYGRVAAELKTIGIENPLPYRDLWEWYDRWSSGDMPTYSTRRRHIAELFSPLEKRIETGQETERPKTGWARVDRTVLELRRALEEATNAEHFQVVGLLCRETLISLAQAVYDSSRHPPTDGVNPSKTDAGRMLSAYIDVELSGGASKEARSHAKSALALALKLQHDRDSSFRGSAMCAEATSSLVHLVAIISGRHAPTPQPVSAEGPPQFTAPAPRSLWNVEARATGSKFTVRLWSPDVERNPAEFNVDLLTPEALERLLVALEPRWAAEPGKVGRGEIPEAIYGVLGESTDEVARWGVARILGEDRSAAFILQNRDFETLDRVIRESTQGQDGNRL